jgi:DNA replication protein DnaC
VPVDHPDFGQLIPCPDCHAQKQTQSRRQQSQLEGQLIEQTFGNYKVNHTNQAAFQAAQQFAQQPRAWLTLWGSYGPGKTHLLAAIVNHCLAHNIPAAYYTLPDLLDQFKDSYKRNDYSPLSKHLRTIQVLALDEVDKAQETDWAVEKIYQLADARYRRLNELGTLFALNINPRHSLARLNDARLNYLFSRMLDQRSRLIHLAGPDARPLVESLWTA